MFSRCCKVQGCNFDFIGGAFPAVIPTSQHKQPFQILVDSMENGTAPTVAKLAAMTTEERMAGMEHSEVRYFTRYEV